MHARNDGTDTTKAYVPVSNNTKRECQIVWIFGAVSLAVIVEFLHILKISCIQKYFRRSSVGTLFALPWFLTWFGHSLNSYRNVVRLYDYFLASPFLMPLYVTAAIVLYREDDIFKEDCDMASLHCLLSQVRKSAYFPIYPLWNFFFFLYFVQLPEDLPFEYLLQNAEKLYEKHPPEQIELDVQQMIIRELVNFHIGTNMSDWSNVLLSLIILLQKTTAREGSQRGGKTSVTIATESGS